MDGSGIGAVCPTGRPMSRPMRYWLFHRVPNGNTIRSIKGHGGSIVSTALEHQAATSSAAPAGRVGHLPYAYFEGKIVPLAEANVSVATHALQYGTGAFGGIRGYLS